MDDAIDVVESRTPEGYGFLVKVRASGQVYRVEPTRQPGQPRYWCVLVYRCAASGVAVPDERPWLGAGGMTRDEIPTAMAAIRADIGAWLAQESCQDLRSWLLTPVPPPDPSLAPPLRPVSTRTPTAKGAVTAAAAPPSPLPDAR